MGIVGAGMMGRSIAAAHVEHGIGVVIHDADVVALEGVVAAIEAELGGTDSRRSEAVGRLVRPAAELAEAARCNLVVEAIVETLSAKEKLFRQMRPHLAEQAIVTSNTSTIPIGRLAGSVGDASRFCGMHFLHPVRQRLLVEVVGGGQTSDATIRAVTAHLNGIHRIPLVVRDRPGFVVNRLLFPYLGEALELLRQGVPPEWIEQAAARFGMALGPLRLIDEIGLDTVLQAGWVLSAAYPQRIMPSPLLVAMIKAGRLGRKRQAGFFAYDHGGRTGEQIDPAAAEILAPWIASAADRPHESLSFRLVAPMLLEATRMLEEGQVRDAGEIDLAACFGLGFPAEKGGPLRWADTVGADHILRRINSLRAAGPGCQPTSLLRTMARSGRRFYPAETWPSLGQSVTAFWSAAGTA